MINKTVGLEIKSMKPNLQVEVVMSRWEIPVSILFFGALAALALIFFV